MVESSPSPSSWAASLRATTNDKSFRIPGPSSRFHKENHQAPLPQEPRPKYTRFSSASPYSPTTRTGSRLSIGSSNPDSSPHPLRPQHTRSKSTTQSVFMAQYGPLTPMRSPRPSSLNLYDSPFSDYFTDENRSVDDTAQYATPSSESHKLLLRLNSLGAEILRQDLSGPTTTTLGAKLDDLEAALLTPDASRNKPSSLLLSDSGLGITDSEDDDNEEQEDQSTPSAQTPEGRSSRPATPQQNLDGTVDPPRLPSAIKAKLRTQDRLLREAQEVLQRVSRANDSLRKRYEEIRRIQDSTVVELEEAAQEALILKSENESLRADLGFDHSELLFMKLQLKALEVEADALSERADGASDPTKKRVLLNDDIDRWKADWDDVDARLRSRREKHRVVSTTPIKFANARDSPKTEDQGNWRLDMCKKRHGRVQSITIKRLNSANLDDVEDGAEDEQNEQQDDVVFDETLKPVAKPTYCEKGVQTDDLSPKPVYSEQAIQTEEPAPKPIYCEQEVQTEEPLPKPTYSEQSIQTDEPEPEAKPMYSEQSIQTDEPELEPRPTYSEQSIQTDEPEPELKPTYSEQSVQTDEPEPKPVYSEQAVQTQELMTKPSYSEQATQTDAIMSPYDRSEPSESDREDAGAVSTDEDEEPAPKRTPWRELCDSLSSFAGMDRD